MPSYKELLQQRDTLTALIEETRKNEISEAVGKAKELVQIYGLTITDIFSTDKKQRKQSNPVAPKYKDPATGATWTGRGIAPKWIKDKDKASFLIQAD